MQYDVLYCKQSDVLNGVVDILACAFEATKLGNCVQAACTHSCGLEFSAALEAEILETTGGP